MRTLILRFSALTSLILTISLTPTARAADPLPRAELDARLAKALVEAIRVGAPVFNEGNHDGCYRLYQGTLLAVAPLLDHRPQLRDTITASLTRARTLPNAVERAFALRQTIDTVYAALAQAEGEKKKPLWDRLGGEPAVRLVIHDFVAAAASDPKVNFTRSGKFPIDEDGVKRLEQRLVELVSAVSGGPLKYTGRDMATAHAGMRITEEEFNALAGDLVATLKKYKVPPAEIDELVGIVATTKKDIVGK